MIERCWWQMGFRVWRHVHCDVLSTSWGSLSHIMNSYEFLVCRSVKQPILHACCVMNMNWENKCWVHNWRNDEFKIEKLNDASQWRPASYMFAYLAENLQGTNIRYTNNTINVVLQSPLIHSKMYLACEPKIAICADAQLLLVLDNSVAE